MGITMGINDEPLPSLPPPPQEMAVFSVWGRTCRSQKTGERQTQRGKIEAAKKS